MPKLLMPVISTALSVLFVTVAVALPARADTKPYFRTNNGDVFAGGWFDDDTNPGSCSGNYQGPTYNPSLSNRYNGAIMGWAQVSGGARTGASAEFGAFATGLIEGIDTPSTLDYGFFSGLANQGPPPAGTKTLSLSNDDRFSQGSAFWGGLMEGDNLNAHCIPDYFDTKKQGSLPDWPGFGSADGQYLHNGDMNLSGVVPNGRNIALFVEGDVTINGDVRYQAGYDINHVPKFALVVKGNIYINFAVDRIDGWYIAQPNGASGGEIWTCRQSGAVIPDPAFIRANCDEQQLSVNGALTSKQLNLGRIIDDLSSDPAEEVDYTPEMVLGGPFFEEDDTNTTGVIQSLISLPPVF